MRDEINNEFLPAIKIRDWFRANTCLSEMFKTVDLLNITALDMFYEAISLHLMDIIEYEGYL